MKKKKKKKNTFFRSLRKVRDRFLKLLNPGPTVISVKIDTRNDDWCSFSRCKKALKKLSGLPNAVLEIEVFGSQVMNPSACVALYELLSQRGSVRLKVQVHGNVIQGVLLLLLVADSLQLNETAWSEISTAEELCGDDDECDGDEWKTSDGASNGAGVRTVKEPPFVSDQRTIYSILNQYLPLGELRGKRWATKKTFAEFGLLPEIREEWQSLLLATTTNNSKDSSFNNR